MHGQCAAPSKDTVFSPCGGVILFYTAGKESITRGGILYMRKGRPSSSTPASPPMQSNVMRLHCHHRWYAPATLNSTHQAPELTQTFPLRPPTPPPHPCVSPPRLHHPSPSRSHSPSSLRP